VFFRGRIEFRHAIEIPVIGYSEAGHAQNRCFFDQGLNASRAVEKGELRVAVKVTEVAHTYKYSATDPKQRIGRLAFNRC
jgi:hypothetical protein